MKKKKSRSGQGRSKKQLQISEEVAFFAFSLFILGVVLSAIYAGISNF